MTPEADLTDQEILDRLADWIVRRRLTAPAVIFLESHRPLSFIGSQAMIFASPIVHFFEPFLQGLAGPGFKHDFYKRFAELMENRENLERLIITIERRNQEFSLAEKEEKARLRALKREAKERRKALRIARKQGIGKGES